MSILSVFQFSCSNSPFQRALEIILSCFQREAGSVLTSLLFFLGILAHNPGRCSFVFRASSIVLFAEIHTGDWRVFIPFLSDVQGML